MWVTFRGAELEREKLCCEKLRAELANVHQQLILAKDENRVTEASQITYRMVTSAGISIDLYW